jgi:Relaxase/Mobilisation nuclease domain
MIPRITSGGHSFKGAFQYYLHDKNADSSHRVAWTQVENMHTDDAEKAWKIMAFTARARSRLKEASGQSRAGRKLEKPVFAFSLAWHPEQSPSQEHMLETARKAIDALGLGDHESVIVAHSDEPQKHVHVIVNRVHPITGLAGDVRNSKRKLSDFALGYEREDGHIYCEQREANHRKREEGEVTHYGDPHIVEAWQTTDCGRALVAALRARGYVLAQGRRIVVIDPHGNFHNPVRHLEGVNAKAFRERLRDLDLTKLPDAYAVAAQLKTPEKAEDEQRAAFEEKAETQREALREKHRCEYANLEQQQSRRIVFAKDRLAKHYALQQQKDELKALTEKIKRATWLKKLLGLTHQDRKTLYKQACVYRHAVGRYRDGLARIADENQKALAELKTRQHNERSDFERHIEIQRENGQGVENRNEPKRERSRLGNDFIAAQQTSSTQGREKMHESRLAPRSRS